MKLTSPGWSLAIFAARESAATLRRCIAAAVAACAGRPAAIDVLVNGNRALAAAVAQEEWAGEAQVRVWHIDMGDKAHAWNQYLHRVWPGGRHALFIDGYTEVQRDALAALSGRAADQQGVHEQLLKTGGQHANLHALGAATMTALRKRGFRLPLGLYRSDALIGAVLGFGLGEASSTTRLAAAGAASTRLVRSRPRPRQPGPEPVAGVARAARPQPAEAQRAGQLIHDWLVEHPRQSRPVFFKRPLCLGAARKLKAEQDWATLWTPPELVSRAPRR